MLASTVLLYARRICKLAHDGAASMRRKHIVWKSQVQTEEENESAGADERPKSSLESAHLESLAAGFHCKLIEPKLHLSHQHTKTPLTDYPSPANWL